MCKRQTTNLKLLLVHSAAWTHVRRAHRHDGCEKLQTVGGGAGQPDSQSELALLLALLDEVLGDPDFAKVHVPNVLGGFSLKLGIGAAVHVVLLVEVGGTHFAFLSFRESVGYGSGGGLGDLAGAYVLLLLGLWRRHFLGCRAATATASRSDWSNLRFLFKGERLFDLLLLRVLGRLRRFSVRVVAALLGHLLGRLRLILVRITLGALLVLV